MAPVVAGWARQWRLEWLILFTGTALLLHLPSTVCGQISSFPYAEGFDSIPVPHLPPGWLSSRNRNSGSDDFTLTSSLPRSEPNAVLSTNASVEQWLVSPLLDFSDLVVDSMTFYTRRSSSHRAILAVEASLDGGLTYPLGLGESPPNYGATSYVCTMLPLPPVLSNTRGIRFRWRIIPDQSGVTGTLRIDDLMITVIYARDLELVRLLTIPQFPIEDDSVVAYALVRNAGAGDVEKEFSVECFVDANADSLPQPTELLGSVVHVGRVVSRDSLTIALPLKRFSAGEHLLITRVISTEDQTTENNLLRTHLLVGYPRGSVMVNEIMFDPLVGGSEYVELANVGGVPVDLHGWTVVDRSGAGGTDRGIQLASESRFLHPGEFFVLAADSSLLRSYPYLTSVNPSLVCVAGGSRLHLNNDGDDVVVRDRGGSVIDSVAYLPTWHNHGLDDPRGRSLEKIRPGGTSNDRRNWSSCAAPEGGTPARANSITASTALPSSARLSVSPNPFSPDGDGVEDFAVIRYRLLPDVGMVRLRIFDARGRLIRNLANNEPIGSQGEVVWDGRDDDGRKARIGPYILLLEAVDGTPGVIETAKAVVVVATSL